IAFEFIVIYLQTFVSHFIFHINDEDGWKSQLTHLLINNDTSGQGARFRYYDYQIRKIFIFLLEQRIEHDLFIQRIRKKGIGARKVDRKSTRLNSSHVKISY